VFTIDGKELARKKIPHTIPLLMSIDETFDVGSDPATAVKRRLTSFHSASPERIDKLTFNPAPSS